MAVVLGWPGRMTDPAFGIDERLVVAGDLKVVLHRPLAPRGTPRQPAARQGGHRQGRRQRRHHPEHPRPRRRGRNAGRDRGQQHVCAQAWRLRRQGDRDAGAARRCRRRRRRKSAICRPPPNLALLYRLNGDENPLHADPERAKVAGFDRPILHGAASFGIAAHAILRTCADYRPERLASIEARFSRPVFPGETIRTEMWPERRARLVPVPGGRARRDRAQQRPCDLEDLTVCLRKRRGTTPRCSSTTIRPTAPSARRCATGSRKTCRPSFATGRRASIRPSSSRGTASSTSAAGSRPIGRRSTAAWARRSRSRSSCSRRSAGSARPRPIRTASISSAR